MMRERRGWIALLLGLSVVVVIAAAFLASGEPDGLERVAQDEGFLDAGQDSPFQIIADYAFPGLDGPMATIVAGLVGIALLFVVLWLTGRVLARRGDGPR